MTTIKQWLHENAIEEVEAIIPDFAGTGRGKFVPTERYLEDEGIRIAEALFTQTIDGEYTDYVDDINPTDVDMELRPDPESIRIVPWAPHPTAQIIHDCYHLDGTPVRSTTNRSSDSPAAIPARRASASALSCFGFTPRYGESDLRGRRPGVDPSQG